MWLWVSKELQKEEVVFWGGLGRCEGKTKGNPTAFCRPSLSSEPRRPVWWLVTHHQADSGWCLRLVHLWRCQASRASAHAQIVIAEAPRSIDPLQRSSGLVRCPQLSCYIIFPPDPYGQLTSSLYILLSKCYHLALDSPRGESRQPSTMSPLDQCLLDRSLRCPDRSPPNRVSVQMPSDLSPP